MIHYSHMKCDDCGERHTPGNKEECIEGLLSRIEGLKEELKDAVNEYIEVSHDRNIELEQCRAEIGRLKKACELYEKASYQGHSAHWDSTGGHGAGCPACIEARELRAQALKELEENNENNRDV